MPWSLSALRGSAAVTPRPCADLLRGTETLGLGLQGYFNSPGHLRWGLGPEVRTEWIQRSGVSLSPPLAHPLAPGLPSHLALIGFRLNGLRFEGRFLLGSRSPGLRWKCLRGVSTLLSRWPPMCLRLGLGWAGKEEPLLPSWVWVGP